MAFVENPRKLTNLVSCICLQSQRGRCPYLGVEGSVLIDCARAKEEEETKAESERERALARSISRPSGSSVSRQERSGA